MAIHLTWSTPTKHTSGRPVKAGALAGYELFMKVDGAPEFTSIADLDPEDTMFVLDVDDAGDYDFRLVALGTNGTRSAPATGSVSIADSSPIEMPKDFIVELV